METVLITADWQWPFTDRRALSAVLRYAEELKPDMVVHLGDILDVPYLSTKFLRKAADPAQLMKDICDVRRWLEQFKAITPRQVFIVGNHCERLNRYVIEQAPALQGLLEPGQPLDLRTLLDPEACIIDDFIAPYGEAFIWKSIVMTHGNFTGKYPAHRELEFENSSGISGHTHRLQVATKTDRTGPHAWYSMGCLCNTAGKNAPPSFRKGTTVVHNWTQGFGIIHAQGAQFQIYPVNIVKGKFIAPDGTLWGPRGRI